MKSLRVALLIIAGLAGNAWGEANAVIRGPANANPGDLVVLSGTESAGDGYRWIIPDNVQTLQCNVLELAFAVGTPGQYTFGLIAADKEAAIDYTTFTVTIGTPAPIPDPVPDPIPDDPRPDPPAPPLENLRKLSHDTARRLADADTAKGLAEAIRGVDAQIETMCSRGQCPGLAAAKQMMVAAIEARLAARRGSSLQKNWLDEWRRPVNDAIQSFNPADVPTYRASMRAVALGLTEAMSG